MRVVYILSMLLAVAAGMDLHGDETLFEQVKDFKLGNRQSKVLSFPGVDPAKGRVVVDLRCRIDYPRAAGWCPCWQIEVNGKAITATATRSETCDCRILEETVDGVSHCIHIPEVYLEGILENLRTT